MIIYYPGNYLINITSNLRLSKGYMWVVKSYSDILEICIETVNGVRKNMSLLIIINNFWDKSTFLFFRKSVSSVMILNNLSQISVQVPFNVSGIPTFMQKMTPWSLWWSYFYHLFCLIPALLLSYTNIIFIWYLLNFSQWGVLIKVLKFDMFNIFLIYTNISLVLPLWWV